MLFVFFLFLYSLSVRCSTSSPTTQVERRETAFRPSIVEVQPFPQPTESDFEHEQELILLSEIMVKTWIKHVQGESPQEPDLSSLYAFVRRAYEDQQERLHELENPSPSNRRPSGHWCARL
jgi:hypothetical protein